MTWTDYRDLQAEIYYAGSSDGGVTWSADTRLSSAAGESQHPHIAVSNSYLHVTWYDGRDGNAEIYYKRYIF